MFAVYVFAGTFVQGIAAITLAAVLLRKFISSPNGSPTEDQLHDLGKMLFAFSTFWAYIWTCQYLLIWYGNIPEEVTHYIPRTNGPWLYLFALNLIVNWVIPFVVLLSASRKRSPKILAAISSLLLLGHWLDLYLLIMPTFRTIPSLGMPEIVITVGYMALLFLLFVNALRRAPIVPLNDPILNYEKLVLNHEIIHRRFGANL
jgi:Ni/Fe-hydrogenase subunit HybB-like protein